MSELSVQHRVRLLLPRLIGIFFGSMWGVIAALALPRHDRPLAVAVVVVIFIGCLVRSWTRTPSGGAGTGLFGKRAYLVAVGSEIAAMYVAALTLSHFGLQEYVYSAVGVIVGLHFIGLWKASGSRDFLTVSAAMCFVSALSMLAPFSWRMCNLRYLLLGAGNAVILWLGATEGR